MKAKERNMKMNACVERGGNRSYSCRAEADINNCLLIGYGDTAKEAMDDLYVAYEELKVADGGNVPVVEFDFKFDTGSLFNYYNFLSIEGVAKIVGISPSVLRQYASGARNPKEKTIKQIEEGLRKISEQLKCVVLCA